MRKLLVAAILVSLVATDLYMATPVIANAQGIVPLSPCKFAVGIGQAKQQVDAQCGVVSVPEDYTKPTGKKIDLHFTLLAATGTKKQSTPIFYLEGGPGGSAINGFGENFYSAFSTARQDHDVVLLDQRGTGQSGSIQCTEITDAALADLNQPETKEDSQIFLSRMKACLKRLSATTNPALYTSIVFADDTDALRAALGYDQIDVYGGSYGTWLGQIYLHRHGDHVHAMVLDSVAGPWNFYLLDAANNAQAALDKIFALCQADADCNAVYPDLSGKLKATLDKLDKNPVSTSGMGIITGQTYPVLMTKSRFLDTLQLMMYQSGNISLIPQIIAGAASGDFTLAAPEAVLGAELASEISLGFYYSVHCSESVPFYTPALIKQYQHGSFYGLADNGATELVSLCKVWPSAELNAADVAPVQSDRPVLIYVGAFDPITSIAFGEETHKRLSNSTLVVFPYQAHGPLLNSKCAQKMMEAFIDAPSKAVDTTCTTKDVKPIFSGAYKVDLVPYTDPNNTFTANIPKAWIEQTAKASGPMRFFTSPDGTQLLGLGNFKATDAGTAQQQALDIIGKAYGPTQIQTTQSILFITIIQHSLDTPDEVYVGALLISQLGADTHVVWLAAPANILQAMLFPVLIPITTSFVGH